MPLQPRENEFYQRILDWAQSKNWSGSARKKIDIEDLWTLFGSFAEQDLDGETPRSVFRHFLDILRRDEKISFIGKGDRQKVALPTKIWLNPVASPEKPAPRRPSLHPELAWFAEHWLEATEQQRKVYEAINTWLWSKHDLSALDEIPVNERALEIFGNLADGRVEPEKIFDGWTPGFRLADRSRLFELLRARETPYSLLSEQLNVIGPGKVMLIVENLTTAWSLRRFLPGEHALRYLVCSNGNALGAFLRSFDDFDSLEEIRYFGDLDRKGINIPRQAAGDLKERGLPDLKPAVELYSALLARGKPSPSKGGPVPKPIAEKAAAWLAEPHREQAVELLVSGRRLAQEWVGFDYLNSHTEWHSDVC